MEMKDSLVQFLKNFEENKGDVKSVVCAYLYGPSGCGKTSLVLATLEENGYDPIVYNAGDTRNKSIVESMTTLNMASCNVLTTFFKTPVQRKKIALVLDEIEGMNIGDKSALNALIKLVRPKRSNKPAKTEQTSVPIICIGNDHVDKKISELMKCSTVIRVPPPCDALLRAVAERMLPGCTAQVQQKVAEFADRDLKKLKNLCSVVERHGVKVLDSLERKPVHFTAKTIVKDLLVSPPRSFDDHAATLNECDRTVVAMIWHENVADHVTDPVLYHKMLDNICFADYVDRFTFQKQTWQLNELTSLTKTFYAGSMLPPQRLKTTDPEELRFTKILTKYSTEYNNAVFLQHVCSLLGMDKKDMFSEIAHLRKTMSVPQIVRHYDVEGITEVEVNRVLRFQFM
jgi:hypothetical protein